MKLTDMFEAPAFSCSARGKARAWPALLLGVSLSGCGYGYHDHYDGDHDYVANPSDVSCGDVIEEATIDADEALEVEPGAGAGAFIEYEAGGIYHATTSCDAAESGECFWDIVVTPLDDAAVLAVAPLDLESDDSVSLEGSSVRLVATTGTDFDGFTLETEAGAGIRFDALLDNGCGNRYLFWVGDGALHSGAPSNPIDLIPNE